ncbi:hypothetical protein V6N11_061742 [Hibiscus sabdariffa]
MIQRDNEVCCSGMDLLEECGIQIDDQQILSKETNMGSPTGSGLKARAKLSDVIERGREQHKVRQLSGILMSEVPPEDRIVTTKGVPKRGRGRSKTKNIEHRDGTDSLVCKMRALKEVLKVWNRDSFGNVDDNYRELVNALEQLDTKQGGGELDDNDLSHKRDLVSKL